MIKSTSFKSAVMGGAGIPRSAAFKSYLIIFSEIKNDPTVISIQKDMSFGRKIPGCSPDIGVDSPIVSRKHGKFLVKSDGVYYQDTESYNGTFINGKLYKQDTTSVDTPIKLKDGDIIRIDNCDSLTSHKDAVTIIFSTTYDKRSKWRRFTPKTAGFPIGRSTKNIIEFNPAEIAIQDVAFSLNKTEYIVKNTKTGVKILYNNTPVNDSCRIKNKDILTIGRSYIYIENNQLLYNLCLITEPGLCVNLKETYVADKLNRKVLLRDIDLEIDRGDFALIIGGSGAGKSTFMNSILGKYDVIGTVKLGHNIVSGNADLTSGIAYVPQTLPIRKEERLIDVVTDTCILRCHRRMSDAERAKHVLDTLDSVGLKGKAYMEIKKLSGGEQRRAAIANEVVTESDVFFLDEPDSGLDPKSGMELMNNLKALSDVGKIVMLISHNYASYPSPEKIYTKVIILAKSNKDSIGRLAFCGSIPDALEFFGVSALKDITKLINPVSENGEGRADEFVEKFRRMYRYG